MARNIVLFGMMGVGKSTVAGLLGIRLGREVVDTDRVAEEVAGASILAIFSEQGEDAFRDHERAAVARVADRKGAILSVGGGAVLDDGNVTALRERGLLVHLAAPADVLAERLEGDDARPLLAEGDLRDRLAALLEERAPRYREVADVEVDATPPPEEVADRVLAAAAAHGDVLTPAERSEVPA